MAAQIGDIIEIKTGKGLAYAQYTHRNKPFGALIRVFEGLHALRPSDLEQLAASSVAFSTFFPLNSALREKVVEKVGRAAIAPQNQAFPLFRDGVHDPITKKVGTWWLWDGTREWKVGKLKPGQYHLPIRGVWNLDLLVMRIEEGWRQELSDF